MELTIRFQPKNSRRAAAVPTLLKTSAPGGFLRAEKNHRGDAVAAKLNLKSLRFLGLGLRRLFFSFEIRFPALSFFDFIGLLAHS